MSKSLKQMPICHVHNIVEDLLTDSRSDLMKIKYIKDDSYKDEMISKVCDNISQSLEFLKIALDKGQRMEDRLRLYKTTIESLGFIRERRV